VADGWAFVWEGEGFEALVGKCDEFLEESCFFGRDDVRGCGSVVRYGMGSIQGVTQRGGRE
jgi:hypothetical protein